MNKTKIRMLEWLAVSLLLLCILAMFDLQLAMRQVQKLTNVTLFGWTGYIFAKGAYAMLSPKLEDADPKLQNALILGRAIVVGAAMIAGALGL